MIRIRVHNLFLLLIIISGICSMQEVFGQYPAGARQHGLGGLSVCVDGTFAVVANPAAMATLHGIRAGVSHRQHYMLESLSTSSVGINWSDRFGAVGCVFSQTGIPEFRNFSFALGYGKKFGQVLNTGLALHYSVLSSPAVENNYRTATFSVGFLIDINDSWCAGLYVFNPVPPLSPPDHNLFHPPVYRAGFLYRFRNRGFLSGEIEKVSGLPPGARIGFEYGLLEKMFIRTGIRINPLEWSFGSGLWVGPLILDISASLHPALGITPELSITYQLRKNEN